MPEESNRPTSDRSDEGYFEVVWPLGRKIRKRQVALRPVVDLAHARIAFVWDDLFRGDVMFRVIANELNSTFPDLAFIDYPMFGNIHGPDEDGVFARLPGLLRKYEVDAAIVGVAA